MFAWMMMFDALLSFCSLKQSLLSYHTGWLCVCVSGFVGNFFFVFIDRVGKSFSYDLRRNTNNLSVEVFYALLEQWAV